MGGPRCPTGASERETSLQPLGNIHKGLFINRPSALRAIRGRLEDVIGNGGIVAGDAVQHGVERRLRIVRAAHLTSHNELLRPSEQMSTDEDDVLIFRLRVKGIAHNRNSRLFLIEQADPCRLLLFGRCKQWHGGVRHCGV